MLNFYTGIGSRKTPPLILTIMIDLATKLQKDGYILRSGGASGADTAFETGAGDTKEIYLSGDARGDERAAEIAAAFHPVWNRLSSYVKLLHTRNVYQVLGKNLDTPSKFLVCWTPDGAITHAERSIDTGGTGTAISIASKWKIPVYNLCRGDHRDIILKYLRR